MVRTILIATLGVAIAVGLAGCAATSSGRQGYPPPIPEGKGRLILDTGGISQVNFYIVDQENDAEVHADTPRMSATSPAAYLRGNEPSNLSVDLPPGTYTVTVNTDIDDDVIIEDVEIAMGVETYVLVPIGRFAIRIVGSSTRMGQIPFIITDYNMRSVLGKGITTNEVKYFLVPAGRTYKVRMENSPVSFDEIIPVQVSFGGITQLEIGTRGQEEDDGRSQSSAP